MKVALYTNSQDGSGARRVFFEFVKRLSSHNILDLYHLSGTPLERLPFRRYVNQVYTFDLEWFNEWTFKPYVLCLLVNFLRKMFYLRKLRQVSRDMVKEMHRRSYDLAFFDVCNLIRVPYHLRHLKIPSVLYLHHPKREAYEPVRFLTGGFYADGPLVISAYKALSRWIYILDNKLIGHISKVNCQFASLVQTNSYYTREYIYKVYGVLAQVNYPGVDSEVFRPLGLDRKNSILSVGGIEESKGFKDIVRALAMIPDERRPDLILVAGRKQPRIYEELTKLARENKVDLTIHENIDDEHLIRLYNEVRLVIFFPLMEPLGLVTLESMACGTPVIGVKEGGVRETLVDGQTGLLIDRDRHALAQAIIRLMDCKNLYERLSRNGPVYIREHWSWDRSVERLEYAFRVLIE
jgi:glycosyltransferase involved in cell wall biosynthesis